MADSLRRKIMLVDDNMANLTIGKNMLKDAYQVFPIPSAARMFELLESITPDLILLDIEMPDENGFEAMQKLRLDPRFADTPVIFLTARQDEASELEGLSLGAGDYISKPFSAPLLLKRIENHLTITKQRLELKDYSDHLEEMVRQKTSLITNLQNALLATVADMVESRDDVTGGHVSRTQRYFKLMIDELILEELFLDTVNSWDIDYLLQSIQLHDVGKIAISDSILNKPGSLSDEEREIMKTHTTIGLSAISRIEQNTVEHAFLRYAKTIAGTHHERWDGTGYPNGLAGENIPLEGRIMAIVDVYDALISERSYKRAFSTEEAVGIIAGGRGTHFDPVLVDVFLQIADKFARVAELTA
ncbi:MAG: response regulator [Oscillospiraceae bacterium]|jgi:putative two-component system response regulator|nr:response regulator [Oscillospiraceae bacterium]